MSRRQEGGPSAAESYKSELRDAISHFLPHQGLPLLSGDRRVRWTARMLAMTAILMAYGACPTLLDRFTLARAAVAEVYRTRRRPGECVEGFFKALIGPGVAVLEALCEHWRRCVKTLAAGNWEVDGWLLFGVDGSKFDCPRTVANEQGFGVSGKNNSGPQQLLTCLFHVGCGMLWAWRRDGVQGEGERSQLKKMLHLLPPSAMLLADAGFTGYELLKALMGQGNHFLIRVGSNVRLIRKLGYAKVERGQTVYLWPLTAQSRNRRSMPNNLDRVMPPLVLRLIELTDAKGKKVFLLTNVLQPSRLSDRAAAKMYRLRWGVELMWRGLKQTMGHHKLLSRTPARAGAELDWAMAGFWMLQLIGGSHVANAKRSPTAHSPAATLRVVRRAMSGERRRRRSLRAELGMAVKDTYRRTGSKTSRYRRQRRPQRPPGVPEARTASAIEKRIIQRLFAQKPPNSAAA